MNIQQLKLTDIVENPENPRIKLGDLSSLVASIQAIGLVEPIVVRKLEGKPFIIVSGARRYAACKKLKHETIPCVIREDETNEALASIAENTAREDLTVEELAVAVNRLEGLSMSDEELGAALAISSADVGHARAVSRASKDAKAKLKKTEAPGRQLTLEESAMLVKYADGGSREREITEVLSFEPDQLAHLVAQFNAEDVHDAMVAELRASMAGRVEVKSFARWERPPAGMEPLHNLATADGKPLTEVKHRTCPNAGFLIGYADNDYLEENPRAVHYCVDWEGSGHKLSAHPKQPWRTTSASGKKPMAEKDKAQRRKVIANNKLWGPAREVRSKWLEEFGQRRELNAKAKLWVLSELIADASQISPSHLKGEPPAFEQAFVTVFMQLVANREEVLARCTWRPQQYWEPLCDRYFRMLKDQGYPVSEVESLCIRKEPKAKKSS